MKQVGFQTNPQSRRRKSTASIRLFLMTRPNHEVRMQGIAPNQAAMGVLKQLCNCVVFIGAHVWRVRGGLGIDLRTLESTKVARNSGGAKSHGEDCIKPHDKSHCIPKDSRRPRLRIVSKVVGYVSGSSSPPGGSPGAR